MIDYHVRGRTLSVQYSQSGQAPDAIQLSVTFDRRRVLDPSAIADPAGGPGHWSWSVELSPELCDGRAHWIGLDIGSGGRLVEEVEFSFVAAGRVIDLSHDQR